MKPKIFVFVTGEWTSGDVVGVALAEDGHALASHLSSSRGFLRMDMSLTKYTDWKTKEYEAHYPTGYELVDLIDVTPDDLMRHEGVVAAFARNKTLMQKESEHGRRDGD